MNLPNKLTVLRVVLVPVFAVLVLYSFLPYHTVWALVVFLAASLTDHYDGKIARERNLVTNFGKFLDPLADKLLVITALVCFLQLDLADVWCVLIIIARELLVTSIRLLALDAGGIVIPANKWGKAKTVSQMAAILFILTYRSVKELMAFTGSVLPVEIVGTALLWIAAALTVVSGVIYMKQNMHLILAEK
ncbi:MAG: CDP-diacylglycerol--glycerol-3-phosphate 3-phosphatidyltransferase [Thermocaproicibacter melissae]|jgi:CDP-diacylglycerol---glycerol-3-phosphate 3-phosphatidyltransferase|uniref:CDP-diacylglycerol--glycerol-3-phosphate 3-phosphatidyltransferase n=1 Tax=Thermocaproicibacter melissae TaxID=2966552 RepID=UPI0024B068AA|nr:CDP-diacylglycerol--glycerol-3-phosphate 3-phosphatidyltransferase [Thermocaproicibacter melissae]WBY63775.1 CDP-diacylglycerol--glycerol-3-phosphate 3-phosphatidyltransferase [Thermocaproicibacter melissae]